MPLYVFKCEHCGQEVESIQKYDDPQPTCICGKKMLRQIGLSNFHLKGGGWYKTDYGGVNVDSNNIESN